MLFRSNVKDLSPDDPTIIQNPTEGSSLGLQWNIQQDTFNIKTQIKPKPKTKRGLLGMMMSVWDIFGIAAPAMLYCKLFYREVNPPKEQDPHGFKNLQWDDPLPEQFDKQWEKTSQICQAAREITLTRPYYPPNQGTPVSQQLFAFADASDQALCYVIYLKTITTTNHTAISYVDGNTKVNSKSTYIKGQISIPRAELEAAKTLAERVYQEIGRAHV